MDGLVRRAAASTVASLFLMQARRYPNRVALVEGERRLTYGELASRVGALGNWLQRRGVKQGARIAILSESYVYAPYRDRVLATRDFVNACLGYAAEHRAAIQQLLRGADQATLAAQAPVALRHKFVPLAKPVTIATPISNTPV